MNEINNETLVITDLVGRPTNELTVIELNQMQVIAKKYDYYTKEIKINVKEMFNNYIKIAAKLYNVKKHEYYLAGNFDNVYDYALQFGISKTTCKNLI